MGRAAPVLYLHTPENDEVAGDAGLGFEKDEAELAALLERVAAMPEEERKALGARALASARARYDWEVITSQYEKLFQDLVGK